MSALLKLIPLIKRLDSNIANTWIEVNSWVFFNIRGGYKCSICGAKHLKFKNGEGEGEVSHDNGSTQRMLLNFSGDEGATVCPNCVLDAIEYVFTAGKDTEIGECDFTGRKNVPVVGIIWDNHNFLKINLRFGREWWNGFSASREALMEAIKSCKMHSSFYVYKNKRMRYSSGKYVVANPQTYDDFYKKNFK